MVKVGGFYVVDDLCEQPNWPEGHAEKCAALIQTLESQPNFQFTKMMEWSTGLMVGVKISE